MVFTCVTAWTLADGLTSAVCLPSFSRGLSAPSDCRDSYPAQTTRTEAGLAPAGEGTPSWRTITGLAPHPSLRDWHELYCSSRP